MKAWLLSAALIGGCASTPAYEHIPAGSFVDYGASPLRHTVYLGSDEAFHYFAWENGKSSGNWKVSKSEMPFTSEWPMGQRTATMTKDSSGHWQPYVGSS